jgi:hypothetical protein
VPELKPGDVADWIVVEHHAWGVLVALVDDPETSGSIDMPYLRDLGAGDEIRGTQDFPQPGERVRAMVQVRWPDGRLHLTARRSDIEAR